MTGVIMDEINENHLLIHMGGLGDVCLSRSVFASLSRHYGGRLAALGHRRFLRLFDQYFTTVSDIGSRQWIHLFAHPGEGGRWEQVVFVGKDRAGTLRANWQKLSSKPLVFLDMFPDEAAPPPEPLSVETYQLSQLARYGIEAAPVTVLPNFARRVILYPEKGFSKKKWDVSNFLQLFRALGGRGVETHLLGEHGAETCHDRAILIEDLAEIREFLGKGGVFVSNDSGMAHLAATCGMFTVTVFTDSDPAVWHPEGRNVSLRLGIDPVDPDLVLSIIRGILDRGIILSSIPGR